MKIAIVDDEAVFARQLRKLIGEIDEIATVDCFPGSDGLESILKNEYDIIFMDLDLKEKHNGLEVANLLYENKSASRIVYVTSHTDSFIQQMFDYPTNAAGWLMKPVQKETLEKTFVRIRFELQTEERNKLRIKSKDHDHVMFIDPDDIVYLENTDHDQRFHLRDQEIRVSGRMKDWEKTLPDTFVRCHKGYIVNMKYIAGHRQHEIILKTGNTIALGRVYAKMVLEKYAAYLESRL